ncbi:MAG TPA: PilZ domain-containing protein [Spirochaetales bacterium]|nr:PilZ domain-containing protein [Spirochaetales bacterium]
MKALLLIESDVAADIARFYLRPLGFESVRYRDPLKALDNLEEIDPDAVILSARDYPRHWKVLAASIRAERSKEDCVLILLKGEFFPFEEASKAIALGVNGVVRDDLDDRREQARFQRLLKRYVSVDEARSSERVAPSDWDRLDFMFSHPQSLVPVAGKLETISATGLSFAPDSPILASDLGLGQVLEDCSLRAGDRILSPTCEIVRMDRALGLAFRSMDEEEKAYFLKYLGSGPEREMRALLKKG